MGAERPRGFRDVRMRGFRERAEVDDAVALLKARLSSLPGDEIRLHEAAGRVLAKDVTASASMPPFDRAAMDGYALRGEETFGASSYNPLELQVVGFSLPAKPFPEVVKRGQAVRIMTGAPLPRGTDAVLPAEMAEEKDGKRQMT